MTKGVFLVFFTDFCLVLLVDTVSVIKDKLPNIYQESKLWVRCFKNQNFY